MCYWVSKILVNRKEKPKLRINSLKYRGYKALTTYKALLSLDIDTDSPPSNFSLLCFSLLLFPYLSMFFFITLISILLPCHSSPLLSFTFCSTVRKSALPLLHFLSTSKEEHREPRRAVNS